MDKFKIAWVILLVAVLILQVILIVQTRRTNRAMREAISAYEKRTGRS